MPIKSRKPNLFRDEVDYLTDDAFVRDIDKRFGGRQDQPEPEIEDDRFEITKGFAAGWDQTQALAGGAYAALGSLFGQEEWVNDGLDYYQEQMNEASEYAPAVSFEDDWEGVGDFTDWLAYTVGNVVPSLATTLAGGGIGGFLAKQGVKASVKSEVNKRVKDKFEKAAKDAAEAQATRLTQNQYRDTVLRRYGKSASGVARAEKASRRGALGTAGFVSSTLGTGENFTRIYEETGLEDPAAALSLGIAMGALDVIGAPMRAFDRMFPGESKDQLKSFLSDAAITDRGRVRKMFDAVSNPKGRLGAARNELVVGAVREGITEATQEWLSRTSVLWAKENLPEDQQEQFIDYLSSEDAMSSYIHAGVVGIVGGSTAGSALGLAAGPKQPKERFDINEAQQKQQVHTAQREAAAEEYDKGPVPEQEAQAQPVVDRESLLQTVLGQVSSKNDIRVEEIARNTGIDIPQTQEILDTLEEQEFIFSDIDQDGSIYNINDDADIPDTLTQADVVAEPEPEISVSAEETPAPTTPVEEVVEAEPVADRQGRVEPTVSPAPEETISPQEQAAEEPTMRVSDPTAKPTDKRDPDYDSNGEVILTFPDGDVRRIYQDIDTKVWYDTEEQNNIYDSGIELDGETAKTKKNAIAGIIEKRQREFDEFLENFDDGAETTTATPSEPTQRRNRDNENQFIIEFPDSGNTYTIEQRGEGDQAEWFNVDTNARIGVSRDESIEQLKTAERLASMSRGRRNIEEPPVPTTLSGERASPRGLSGTSRTQEGIPVVQRDSALDVPYNQALGEINGPNGPSVNERIEALNASEGQTVQQKEGDDLVVVQGFGGNYKLLSHIKGRPKRKGGRSNGRPTADMSWLPDALPSPELKSLLEEYTTPGGPELSGGLDKLPPQLQEYMHGILEVIERGIPVEWAFGTTGVYINKGEDSGLATYYISEKALGVKKEFLESAVTDPAKRRYLTHAIAHEIFHYADFKNGYTQKTQDFLDAFGERRSGDIDISLSAFESLDISSSKKDGDRISFDMGDVMAELYELWSNYDETIGYQFRYPLKSAYRRLEEAHNSGDPNKVDDVEEFLRTEMFAQLGAVYIDNPKGLKEKAPKAYAMIRSIVLNPNLTAEEVIFEDSNIRESVEPSDRSVLQDVRSPTIAGSGEVSDRGRVGPDGTGRDLDGTTSEGMGGAPTTADRDTSGRPIPTRPNTLDIRLEDLPPESQQLTATPILYGDETPRSVEGNPTVVKVAREFDNKAKEAYPDTDLSEQTDENAEIVSDLIAHEAIQAIDREGNAGEWYQQKVANAMELAAQRYPELGSAANDPAPKFAFTAIMAVTSNGASVPENSANTFKLYDEYRENGEFTIFGVGKEGPAMKSSFELLNALIKADGIESVINFMNEDITVRDLKSDFGLTVSGELQDTVLKGSAILGPKIGGGFYQNLNGNFDPLTMDRWFMRTYGRLTGSLMKEADRKYPIQLDKFREIALSDEYRNKLRRDGISRVQLKKDDEYAEGYARQIQRAYANENFRNKTEINKASNTFVNSQGEKQAPQNGTEREYIRRVMQMALDKVNVFNSNNPINMGALQAIIWYPEKQLYKEYGVGNKRSEPTDYETEFRKIVQGEEGGQGVPGPDGSALESGTGRVQRTTGQSQQDPDQPDSSTVQEAPKPRRRRNVLSIEEGDPPKTRRKTIPLESGSAPGQAFNLTDEVILEARLSNKLSEKFSQKFVDRYERWRTAENAMARSLGVNRLPAEMSFRDSENLMHSRVSEQLDQFENKWVDSIAELANRYDLSPDQIGMYLLAKHAPERNASVLQKEMDRREAAIARLEKQLEDSVSDTMPEGSPAIAERIEATKAAPFRHIEMGSGMTNEQAAKVINNTEAAGNKNQYEEIANRVYAMLDDMRQNMVNKGLLDETTQRDWESTYQFYVPLKGFMGVDGVYTANPRAKGFNIKGSESMKARGRITLPDNPLLNAFKDAEEKILRAEKNFAAQKLLRLVQKFEAENEWKVYTNRNRPLKRYKDEADEEMSLDDMKRATRDDDGMPRFIQVKRGGQTYFIEIFDGMLNRQLQDGNPSAVNQAEETMAWMFTNLRKFQNFRRNVIINWNPSWFFVNPIRDIETGLAYLLSEQTTEEGRVYGKDLLGDVVKGWAPSGKAYFDYRRGKDPKDPEQAERFQYIKEFIEDGAPTGLATSKSLEELQQQFAKSMEGEGNLRAYRDSLLDWVEHANQGSENAIRISTYIEARKAGTPRLDAATLAKDLTVNFNRKGESSSFIDSLYLFFNAAIQGNVNIVDAIKRGGTGGKAGVAIATATAARKLAMGLIGFGFARTIANIMLAGDDDDGEPKYNDYSSFTLGSTMAVTFDNAAYGVPLPYGWGWFDNVGRIFAEQIMGAKTVEEGVVSLYSQTAHHFAPRTIHAISDDADAIDAVVQGGIGFIPDVGTFVAELGMNINFFGSPIVVPTPYTDAPASSVAKRSTAEAFKWFSKTVNSITGGTEYTKGGVDIAPDKLQAIFDFMLGGLGRFGTDAVDTVQKTYVPEAELKESDIPILRKFAFNPSEYNDQFRYYDNRADLKRERELWDNSDQEARKKLIRDKSQDFYTQLFVQLKQADKRLRSNRKEIRRLQGIEGGDRLRIAKKLEKIEEENQLIYDVFNKRYKQAGG